LDTHLSHIRAAQGADLIVFPELSLTGYVLQDLVLSVALKPTSVDPVISTLLTASENIDTRFGKLGILICEDFWHASPPYLLWLDGADLLLFTSASPGRGLTDEPKLESARWVEHINQAYASLFTTFVVHANRVGFEDGLNFWGGSTVFDPNGELITQGPYFEEELVHAVIDLNQLHRTRARLPLLRDERTSLVIRELNRIVAGNSSNQRYMNTSNEEFK
jgi:predicted amidohydrolase